MRVRTLVVFVTVSVGAIGLAPLGAGATGGLTLSGLSPVSGPVGTSVVLTGTGLRSGDVVRFNGTAAQFATANKAGTHLTASVPPMATSGAVTVTDYLTGGTVRLPGAGFTVTTGVLVSPKKLWPGGNTTIVGSALSPNSIDAIHLGHALIGEGRTDASGNFLDRVVLPWTTTPGLATVTVNDAVAGPLNFGITIVASWPEYRSDSFGTADNPFESALSSATVGKLTEHWNDSTETHSSMAVAAGRVYYGVENTSVFFPPSYFVATDAVSGNNLWATSTSCNEGSAFATPTVANGVMYGVDPCGEVVALNAYSGAALWSTFPGCGFFSSANPFSSPAVVGGILYVGGIGTNCGYDFFALDTSTGSVVWKTTGSASVGSSPVLANGVVYYTSSDGHLYARNATTGALLWSQLANGDTLSSPTIDGGLVLSNSGKTVNARNASSGALVWSHAIPGDVSAAAVAGGSVFVRSDNGHLYALKATTGAQIWAAVTSDASLSPPAVGGGVVYVESFALSRVYGLDASTGAMVWSVNFGLQFDWYTPAISGDLVFFVGAYQHSADEPRAYGL